MTCAMSAPMAGFKTIMRTAEQLSALSITATFPSSRAKREHEAAASLAATTSKLSGIPLEIEMAL